jgi:mono/diheme cytochrome c family protein
MHRSSPSFTFVVALALTGCGKSARDAPPPAPAPTAPGPAAAASADPATRAKDIFSQRCVPCHGATGQGDGPASASLDPKPRKYADKAWQASVTDDYLEKIIKLGGAAVGKSPAMPSNPDLGDPALLAALRDIIRGFAK